WGLITALQTIRARRLDPATPGVVTIGSVHAGAASNVIPERATLSGTIRAVDATSRALMHAEVRKITEGIGAAYGVASSIDLSLGTPPLVNPTRQAAIAQRAAARVIGTDGVVPFGLTNMAGEDFAVYLESLPGCFMRVGARLEGEERTA